MLAIFVLSALMGLALGDPLPPVQKHTEIIHVPAPKPVVKKVPALQEHAVRQIQHVPIRQTVVKEINVPKDIYREVPVIVEKKLILRQPHIRKFPIDVQKTLLQPHIKHVPQVRVNYRKRPYDVWHTKEVKKIINVPRPVPVIKHKIITKVLNRIVDVPHKVYKDKVKVVQVPQPFKVQKVHHRKIDVPIEVRVPVPRVHVKQTQEVQKVPIDVTVVKKVPIPRKTTLTEIVPVPIKPRGCGPDGVACGSLASLSSVTENEGLDVGGVASVVQRQDVVVEGGPAGVVTDTVVGGAPAGVVTDTLIGGGAIGAHAGDTLVGEVHTTGIHRDIIPGPGPVGVVSDIGVVGGPDIGLVGPDVDIGPVGPGIDGPYYGPDFGGIDSGFGPGLDGGATFVESSVSGGPVGEIGFGETLPFAVSGRQTIGAGGRRRDVVSIRHTERLVPVSGGGSYSEGVYPGGDFGGSYEGGLYPDGYLDGSIGGGRIGGGIGGGFGGGFGGGLAGSGFAAGGGVGGVGGAGGTFYQETTRTLPIVVGGNVRGEYLPREDINQVMDSLAVGAGQLGAGGVAQGAFFNGASNDDGDSVGAFADTSFLNGDLAAAQAIAAQAQAQAQAQAFNGGAQAFNGGAQAFNAAQGFHAGQGFGGAQGLGAAVNGVHGFNGGAFGQAFGGAEAAFGGAEAAFAGAQAQAQAQSQAQAQAIAQAQNFVNAQANQIGNSLQSDLQLANQLAFNDKYDVNNYGH